MRNPEAAFAESAGDPPDDVIDQIAAIVTNVMTRRYAGQWVGDEEIVAENPHLMPWLETELEAQAKLHRVYLAAQKAGPTPPPSSNVLPAGEKLNEVVDSQAICAIVGYRILEEIGGGGQATVYAALQEATGKQVAIKILPGGALAGSRHRRRFDREAKILAALNHPNIVGIVDAGRTHDGSFFIVMPLIHGTSLDQFAMLSLKNDPQFPRQMLEVFIKIARAVHGAHERGIIHRDLKPSNLRIDERFEPHVLDFGLARIERETFGGELADRSMTTEGQIVGSLPWASPEHVSGSVSQIDRRSDVYSLGVCLYQCLSGKLPHPISSTIRDLVDQILSKSPPPMNIPQVVGIDLSGLERVVAKALAKLPEQRYASAEDFAGDLEALLNDRPVAAPVLWSLRARRAVLIGIVGTIVAGLAAGIAVLRRPPKSQLPPVTIFVQPSFMNDAAMRMIKISPGRFSMGSPDVSLHETNERWHEVEITRPFWIAEMEVTCRQYQDIMGALPGRWIKPTKPDMELPVSNVSWEEATAFCRKLSERENRQYRLPTEAEWEIACRANAPGEWAGRNLPDEMGWHEGNSGGSIHRGGMKTANSWGLFDMHGNVGEWCQDTYQPSYPLATRDPIVDDGNLRVVRGGAFTAPALECRSASRGKLRQDQARAFIGFRVVTDDRGDIATQVKTRENK